jgi:hypothetical protein
MWRRRQWREVTLFEKSPLVDEPGGDRGERIGPGDDFELRLAIVELPERIAIVRLPVRVTSVSLPSRRAVVEDY